MGALDCVNVNRITPTESTEVFAVNGSETSLDKTRRGDIESQLLHSHASGKRHSIWWRLGIDLPLLLLVLILPPLQELGIFPQHKSGFFCNDPALSYKFTGDTVSAAVIVTSIIVSPFILIWITELILLDSELKICEKMKHSVKQALFLYRNYAYGLVFNIVVVEVMKGITGNPRPTFFDICEPDTAKTCNGSEYVSTFECTSTRYSAWYQMDSYHSFPSGHTSLSVYCGLFIAWYLQQRAFDWRHRSVLAVPVLQLVCLTYAAVCSLTRITDRRHHWWDVLTGAVIGAICVFYTVLVLCKNFSNLKEQKREKRIVTPVQSNRTSIYDTRLQGPLT
ncbi:PREDICTED: lipid phosphate phosphohydrolase 2-like isoform X1 [Papilio xuthus]|uniref:Lipid phosphate phosphohydrolase 2-like isoform X1 n=1 Tax=Papilio xuthus TaxID=66420 RepID=A0AAJ6Z1H0_PAPXU|nr:PREDICTED: lipid phosphate phosphohydrolase 2-like isoform X1 [Papilio xuthus]